MDVLSGFTTYRESDLIIGELFIPFEDKAICDEPCYFEAKSVSINDFDFEPEKQAGRIITYSLLSREVFNIILLYDKKHAGIFPLDRVMEKLKEGASNIKALSFVDFNIDEGHQIDATETLPGIFSDSIVLTYRCHLMEKSILFHLLVPSGFLNFLVFNATSNISIKEPTVVNLFKILKNWTRFIVNGMEIFPWRLDRFLLHLKDKEREELIRKLLEKGYVNFDQLASAAVAFPEVKEDLLESLSKPNRREFLEKSAFFSKINDDVWFQEVIYSVKLSIGHLLFIDGLRIESLNRYNALKDSIENITELETLRQKGFDDWILEAGDRDLDIAIHNTGIRNLATSFLIRDFKPESEKRVLDKLSKRGLEDYRSEMRYLKSGPHTTREMMMARISLVKNLRDAKVKSCMTKLIKYYYFKHDYLWWLKGIGDDFSLVKVYTVCGFPLFIKAFTGVPDLKPFHFFFKAIPKPAADIIINTLKGRINTDKIYSSDVVNKARVEIIKTVLTLFLSHRISLKAGREQVIEEELCTR